MYGMGRNKRVVLFDTLIEQCSEAQVVAVLAHELGARAPAGQHRSQRAACSRGGCSGCPQGACLLL